MHIIQHTKQTLLYYENDLWCKKSSCFDITMGSFGGAEACELVGLHILAKLQSLEVNVGLYRDDGLAVPDKNPKQIEDMKKKICKIFKNNGLDITIAANKRVLDF
ncbi:hypothetical protein ElyMa_000394700 [Elysia marginata]|uniref:Reverse transcriptase domain-containing protein n=1 Tax=Elysia marginata TaxID=1093978 RepID=A0AAV4FJC2_9GAST|nr:hypothetical protein ElyMa_000394700 [Elysia marginata]